MSRRGHAGKPTSRARAEPGSRTPYPGRAWIWIAALVLIHAGIYVNSASVVDTARDLYWAWNIARLEAFPLEGPALAHILHLSPVWFYLLAVPLLFSSAWLGVALWAGLISALQYPLAYLLGRRLGGMSCGVLFAGLSALPGWNFVSYLTVNHVNAIEAATLFILLCTLTWWQTRRLLWLVLLPLAVVLGIHAHPTVYVAGLIAGAVLLADAAKGRLPWRWLLLGIVLGGVPFVPYVISQSAGGWPDIAAGGAWVAGQSALGNLAGVWALWRGVWIDGPIAAWQVILDLRTKGLVLGWIQIVVMSVGVAATAGFAIREPRARAVMAAWVMAFLGVALIRDVTPAYMTGALYAISAGAAAYGLSRLLSPPFFRRGGISVPAALPVLVLLTIMIRLTDISIDGDLKLPNPSLADVRRGDLTPGESFGYFPAWARGELAAYLCSEPGPVTVHGPASIILEQSYALETRMRCGREDLYLGGQVPGKHFIGIIRHDAEALGVHAGRDIGSLRLLEVSAVHHPAEPVAVPVGDVYPPRPRFAPPPAMIEIDIPARPGEWLAVTNLYMVWMSAEVAVRLNGESAEPVRQTRSTEYFHCDGCATGDQWQVTISAPAPEFVEVVTFEGKN